RTPWGANDHGPHSTENNTGSMGAICSGAVEVLPSPEVTVTVPEPLAVSDGTMNCATLGETEMIGASRSTPAASVTLMVVPPRPVVGFFGSPANSPIASGFAHPPAYVMESGAACIFRDELTSIPIRTFTLLLVRPPIVRTSGCRPSGVSDAGM